MEAENENKILKLIIRNLDKRIKYLESRIKDIIDKDDTYICFICTNYCTFDDEKCNCNLFCTNYICKECIYKSKTDKENKSICKNSKCNKWYCSSCINYDENNYLEVCKECNIIQCEEHYNNYYYDNYDNTNSINNNTINNNTINNNTINNNKYNNNININNPIKCNNCYDKYNINNIIYINNNNENEKNDIIFI